MTATAPSTALIGLGANLGDREAALNAAVQSLHATPDSQVLAVSDWIATAAVGGPEGQPDFLNGAALIQTQQSPKQLLESLQSIELALGRQRQTRWEARSIDLDLLLFDEHIVATADLIVPHPWLAVRRFALEPSRQIAPDMVHPGCGWSIARLAEHLDNSPRYVAVLSDEQSGNHRLDWNSSAWQDVAHHGYPHAHLQWIRNPHSQPRDSAAPSLDIPQALELLDQQVEVVKAVDAVGTCDPHQGTVPRGDWYISDFWIGCCGQHVRGSLDELAWFRSQVDAALMALPMPRLLIIATSSVWRAYAQWLAHGEVPGHRSSCWRSVNNHWRGPILFVAGDQDAIVQQLLAALSAME